MLKVREGRYGLQPYINPQNHLAFRPWGTCFISFPQKP